VGEHQTNNSAIFSKEHSLEKYSTAYGKYSTVGHVCNDFELLKYVKVAKMNNLSVRNALNQLKYHHACAV